MPITYYLVRVILLDETVCWDCVSFIAMPIFAYQARDSKGQRITGAHEAADQRTALESLRASGLFVTKLELAAKGTTANSTSAPAANIAPPLSPTGTTRETKTEVPPRPAAPPPYGEPQPSLPGAKPATTPIPPRYWLRSNNKDLALFFRQMHAMLHAGTSLAHAVNTMAENASNAGLRTACDEMKTRIAAGRPLSELMPSYPGIFTPLMAGMIRAGETGGFLDRMCLRLSEYAERDYEIQQLIKRETWYPKLLLLASLFIPTIVPAAIAYFNSTGNWLAIWMRALSTPAIIVITALLLIRFKNYLAPLLKHFSPLVSTFDQIKFMLPIIGKTTRALATAKFCRALGALQAAGMGVQQTVTMAADASGNSVINNSARQIIQRLESGYSLTDALDSTRQFPGVAIQMLRTGEATGSVDEQLDKVADFLERDAETTIKQSVVVLGIVVFLCMAIYIFFTVASQYVGHYNNLMDQADNLTN